MKKNHVSSIESLANAILIENFIKIAKYQNLGFVLGLDEADLGEVLALGDAGQDTSAAASKSPLAPQVIFCIV